MKDINWLDKKRRNTHFQSCPQERDSSPRRFDNGLSVLGLYFLNLVAAQVGSLLVLGIP